LEHHDAITGTAVVAANENYISRVKNATFNLTDVIILIFSIIFKESYIIINWFKQ